MLEVFTAAVLAAAAALPASGSQVASSERQEWSFAISLDGKPVGTHRFELGPAPTGRDERSLRSEAEFAVRVLGVPLYRYRHEARERWRSNCLVELQATTDDGGRVTRVEGRRSGDSFIVGTQPPASEVTPLPACVMTFAYWSPALKQQRQLLNPQTGTLQTTSITALPPTSIDVRGRPVPAEGFRIALADGPIDVWYSSAGAWIGLDASVSGGRRLTYRLQ